MSADYEAGSVLNKGSPSVPPEDDKTSLNAVRRHLLDSLAVEVDEAHGSQMVGDLNELTHAVDIVAIEGLQQAIVKWTST